MASLGLPALALLASITARADSAAPREYRATVTGTTVTVCADVYGGIDAPGRPCPDQGLIRREAATGQAVLITSCDASACFLDECVPPGAYQYGLEAPLACGGAIAYSAYFAAVTTTASVAACTRTRAAPAGFTGTVPWGVERTHCAYGSGSSKGCGQAPGASAGVLTFDAAVLLLGLLLWRRRSRRSRSAPAAP
jgi:hypothetical protein